MTVYEACRRFGYTPDQVRSMTKYDVEELLRYDTWRRKNG